jgi:two-component system torCAD operon response regulator TorR
MSSYAILIVEDAVDCRTMVGDFLRENGLTCATAASLTEMRTMMRLGDRFGLIFLTSRDTDEDEIAGLEAGGDDYVTKPVNLRALLARVRNVLARGGDSVITFDGWILDLIRRELFQPDGRMLGLTSGEFNVLAAMAARLNEPVSRDFLLDVISNRDPRGISAHTIDTLVSRLRRKMGVAGGVSPITTVRGVGYALIPGKGQGPT